MRRAGGRGAGGRDGRRATGGRENGPAPPAGVGRPRPGRTAARPAPAAALKPRADPGRRTQAIEEGLDDTLARPDAAAPQIATAAETPEVGLNRAQLAP